MIQIILKKRLARLEQNVKEARKLCVVQKDADRDRMVIADLNFYGTIKDGEQLMELHRGILFVIFNFSDSTYCDAEWGLTKVGDTH